VATAHPTPATPAPTLYRRTVDTAAEAVTTGVGHVANWAFLIAAAYVAMTRVVAPAIGLTYEPTVPLSTTAGSRTAVAVEDPTLITWLGSTGAHMLWGVVACAVLYAVHRFWRALANDTLFTTATVRTLIGLAIAFGGIGQLALVLQYAAALYIADNPTYAHLAAQVLDQHISYWPMAATGALLLAAAVTKRAVAMRRDLDGLV
jgi:hypothetical protein